MLHDTVALYCVLLCLDTLKDVLTFKRFPHYWPFAREIRQLPVDSPFKGPVMRTFDVSFDVSLNKLLNKLM